MSDGQTNPLKAYRQEHQLSQQAIADKLKVSRPLVSLLETGGRDFTAAMALKIEKELGIDRAAIRPDLFRRGEAPEAVGE